MQFWLIWITLLIILYFVLEIRYPNIWGNMSGYINQNVRYMYGSDRSRRYRQIPTMSRSTRTALIVLCVILLLIVVLNLFMILKKLMYR